MPQQCLGSIHTRTLDTSRALSPRGDVSLTAADPSGSSPNSRNNPPPSTHFGPVWEHTLDESRKYSLIWFTRHTRPPARSTEPSIWMGMFKVEGTERQPLTRWLLCCPGLGHCRCTFEGSFQISRYEKKLRDFLLDEICFVSGAELKIRKNQATYLARRYLRPAWRIILIRYQAL